MRAAIISIVLAAPLALMPAAHAQVRDDPNASVAIQNGDYAVAERQLIAEQKIFPTRTEVLLNLAAIYSKTGRHNDARAIYNRVLTQRPVAMDVADGQVAPSHLVAGRGLRLLDAARQASR